MNSVALKKYVPQQEIGKGGYGTVYKAVNSQTGQIVAIKRIQLTENEEGIKNSTLREVAISRAMSHPNVVKMLEIVTDSKENAVYCVYEFGPMDLRAFIRQNPTPAEEIIRKVAYQCLKGMAYLHGQSIIHRDVKPHNVLLDPATVSIKLIDFGLARPFDVLPTPLSCSCGTKFFLAPELMLGVINYGPRSDLWGIGLIVSQMFSNKYAFPCRENEEGLMKIFKIMGSPTGQLLTKYRECPKWAAEYEGHPGTGLGEFMGNATPAAVDLTKQLLMLDWDQRPSAEEALRHSWFQGME